MLSEAWGGTSDSANAALAARGARIQWGDASLHWIGEVFPPLSVALASLLGSSSIAYAVVAALVVAGSAQRLTGVLVRGRFGRWASAAVALALLAAPPTLYLVTNDLQSILGVALVAVALHGIGSFVLNGSTEAGFRAGLAMGVAVVVDPAAWLYALVLAAAAPFFARRAGRQGPMSHVATVAVLVFPAAAAMGFWAYLTWWFVPDPGESLRAIFFSGFDNGAGVSPTESALMVLLGLAASPLALIAAYSRSIRDPWTLIAPAIGLTGLWASLWLGLREVGGQTYLMLLVLYITLLAERAPRRTERAVITVAAIAQLGIIWWLSLNQAAAVKDWLTELLPW